MALAAKVRRAIRSRPSYCRQFLELRPCKVWRYSPSRCRVGGARHVSDGKSSPWPRRQFWKDRTEVVSFSLALGVRSSQGLDGCLQTGGGINPPRPELAALGQLLDGGGHHLGRQASGGPLTAPRPGIRNAVQACGPGRGPRRPPGRRRQPAFPPVPVATKTDRMAVGCPTRPPILAGRFNWVCRRCEIVAILTHGE